MKPALLLTTVLLLLPLTVIGADWNQLDSGITDHIYGFDCHGSLNAYAVAWGVSPGGIVVRTIDGGDNWDRTQLAANSYLFDVEHVDAQTAFIAGCLGGGSQAAIWRTTDGGDSWISRAFSTSWGFYAVEFPSATIGYACGWTGRIYKTSNGGDNWSLLSSGTGNVFRWMEFVDDTHGYAICGTNYNNPNMVYKTTNGATWSYVKNFGGAVVVGGIHFFDEDTGLMVGISGGYETVQKTYDGGETWDVKHTGPANRTLQGVRFRGDNGIAVGSAGRILISHDAGESWTLDAATTPAITLLAAGYEDDAAYAAGSGGRIFKRGDLTATPESPDMGILPRLLPNYPNPFNPVTTIKYTLPQAAIVSLRIFDVGGRLVRRLEEGEMKSAGNHTVSWNGCDDRSRPLPAGIYFSRLQVKDEIAAGRLVLLE
ncbi:MAG: T9SS type A sorting domain-containing protein [bacterium]|nr:T9SS type A sorting domain-containing protein [bacterium]